jgi:hypothetical protein
LLGGAGVQRAASSGHEHLGIDVEEGEEFLEVELLLSVADWLGLAGFEHDDRRERLDLVFASEDGIV